MPHDETPMGSDPIHTSDPVLAEVLRNIRHVSAQVAEINEALAGGAPIIQSVRELPTEFAVLREQVAMLRLIVYGVVGTSGLGLLGTCGAAVLFFIKAGGH